MSGFGIKPALLGSQKFGYVSWVMLILLSVAIAACGGNSVSSSQSGDGLGASGGTDSVAPTIVMNYPPANAVVSGSIGVSANATDSNGVVGVQFKVDGENLGGERTATPYTVTWDTTGFSDGAHTLTALARDGAGNSTTASSITVVVSNSSGGGGGSVSADNTITIRDLSGTTQNNRPVSIARAFRQGDIPGFVAASIGETALLTQTDVKNRWGDGSVKFAIVSFVIPSLSANATVSVSFSNQSNGNNSAYLTAADMLSVGFDFDATITMVSGSTTKSVSAREMVAGGKFRYWLQGPVVTAIIVEDRTPARSFDSDFGDNSKALHPIFEAWFYSQNHSVDVGYTVENTWSSSTASNSMRDLAYALTLSGGYAAPQVKYAHPSFNHIGRSRWHRRHWVGTTPPPIHINHNKGYLVSTKAIPKYDTTINIDGALVSSYYNQWVSANKSIPGDSGGVGNYGADLGGAGEHAWIGLMNTWDTLYLLTMDSRMLEQSLGNADLAGRIPWHYREADSQAGSGDYFDAPTTGSVDTFGRVVSVNARRTTILSDLSADIAGNCGSQYAADRIFTGTISQSPWSFYSLGRHHMPDVAYVPYLVTGRYYYLEELQYQSAYIIGWKYGCYDNSQSWMRQGHAGYFNDSEVRGEGWSYRTVAYAASISPDGTPEKAYFEDKLLNNIAKDEGRLDVPNTQANRVAHWNWGRTYQRSAIGPSPLGLWSIGDESAAKSSGVKQNGTVSRATPPWSQYFVVASLGMARNLGYPTDGLLKFLAKHNFNHMLNPLTSPYLVEAYEYATTLVATNDWIRNWADVNQYHDVPSDWSRGGSVDHGYGFIALAALSYLQPYTVDGYSGAAAWTFMKNNKPEQSKFSTVSPKWAIVP